MPSDGTKFRADSVSVPVSGFAKGPVASVNSSGPLVPATPSRTSTAVIVPLPV